VVRAPQQEDVAQVQMQDQAQQQAPQQAYM
jgi:hypothetical protein